jgi:hypothetical protein
VGLAILALKQTKPYFYAYYVTKTLTAMVSEGAMVCISLAYVVRSLLLSSTSPAHLDFLRGSVIMGWIMLPAMQADKVPEAQRAAAFGVFSGVCTAGFVAGTIAAPFLSIASTFQVYTCAGLVVLWKSLSVSFH